MVTLTKPNRRQDATTIVVNGKLVRVVRRPLPPKRRRRRR
jgi:hypothetical protein